MPTIKLEPDQLRKIHKAQRRLTDLVQELDKCENCGMDVTKIREIVSEQLGTLQNIDRNFNPAHMEPTSPSPS